MGKTIYSNKNFHHGSSPVAQQVKDLALSLLWLYTAVAWDRFLSPGTSACCRHGQNIYNFVQISTIMKY